MDFLILISSLLGLWLGSEGIVKGATQISESLKVSPFFFGMTVLAFGTDLPELVIAIDSSIRQIQGVELSGFIIGEAIGSSFSQISVVLGLVGLFGYLTMPKKTVMRDGLVLVAAVVLVMLTGLDGKISRVEGLTLFIIYWIYFIFLYKGQKESSSQKVVKPLHLLSFLYLISGFILVIGMSHLVVTSALNLSEAFNVSQTMIGIIAVGLGTSLPELAVSLAALRKGSARLSVGNMVGSNIFDLLLVIGIGATIHPLTFKMNLMYFDLPLLIILSALVAFFFIKKKGLQLKEALFLICFYLAYAGLKLMGV